MPGPPDDIEPSELFLKLKERPRPGEEVPFPALDAPGTRGKIRIQVLMKDDHDRARIIAHEKLKKNAAKYGLPKLTELDMQSEAIRGVESDLACCETLAMACRQTRPLTGSDEDSPLVQYPLVFPDGDAVGKTLSADEVSFLFSAYTLVQHKYGPHEAICLPEDVNAWVRRLVEGAAAFPFLLLSSPHKAELLNGLAGKLYRLSEILESRWTELPESLRSELQTYCLGTGSSGEPVETTTDPVLPGPGREISFEEALRVANVIRPPTPEE